MAIMINQDVRTNIMKNRFLKNDLKSYLIIFICGMIVGIATRLTDFFKADTLWSFSSIATLFGFWIICVAGIVLFSSSNLCAGISSFLYMFGMTFSFYSLQYVLGLFLPMFDNEGFKTSLFLLYSFLSIGCGMGAFILYYWERKTKISAVLYALPVGALVAETIGIGICLVNRSVFLFQFLLDFLAFILLGTIFYKRTVSKVIYGVAICLVTAAVYFIVYQPFLYLV